MPQTLQTETLTPEQKEYLIEKALSSEAGKQALASSMANPIRLTLDYQAIGRKLVVVDPFKLGAYCVNAVRKFGYMLETLVKLSVVETLKT